MNVNILLYVKKYISKNIGVNHGYITLQIVCGRGPLSVLHE